MNTERVSDYEARTKQFKPEQLAAPNSNDVRRFLYEWFTHFEHAAAHLKRRLPSATRLALGFQAIGRLSRGTATTMAENVAGGGVIRRGGKLVRVPAGWRFRTIDFGATGYANPS